MENVDVKARMNFHESFNFFRNSAHQKQWAGFGECMRNRQFYICPAGDGSFSTFNGVLI